MRWYFGFFFASGFGSLLYELVWLRWSLDLRRALSSSLPLSASFPSIA
jgi:hypothetical protein